MAYESREGGLALGWAQVRSQGPSRQVCVSALGTDDIRESGTRDHAEEQSACGFPVGAQLPPRLGAQRPAYLVPQEMLQTLPEPTASRGAVHLPGGQGCWRLCLAQSAFLYFLTHAFLSDAFSADTVTSSSNSQTAFISPDRVNGVRLA